MDRKIAISLVFSMTIIARVLNIASPAMSVNTDTVIAVAIRNARKTPSHDPGQAAHALAAFYISATDSNSAAARFPGLLADNSPARECLVMFGDGNPGGSFGVYHLWITQANAARLASL